MAKRELSSTLKNLKFMQRSIQRQDKSKVEQEVKAEGTSVFQNNQRRKCLVIMEGNSRPPGTIRGRMSFQGFNPSIDKLNEEADPSTASASDQNESFSDGGNDSVEGRSHGLTNAGMEENSDGDHKRKHMMMETDSQNPPSHESNKRDGQSSSKKGKGRSRKKQRRDKLWNLLRPPKPNSIQ